MRAFCGLISLLNVPLTILTHVHRIRRHRLLGPDPGCEPLQSLWELYHKKQVATDIDLSPCHWQWNGTVQKRKMCTRLCCLEHYSRTILSECPHIEAMLYVCLGNIQHLFLLKSYFKYQQHNCLHGWTSPPSSSSTKRHRWWCVHGACECCRSNQFNEAQGYAQQNSLLLSKSTSGCNSGRKDRRDMYLWSENSNRATNNDLTLSLHLWVFIYCFVKFMAHLLPFPPYLHKRAHRIIPA